MRFKPDVLFRFFTAFNCNGLDVPGADKSCFDKVRKKISERMGSESRKLCAVVKTVGVGRGKGVGEGVGVAIRPPTPRNFSKRTTWISGLFRLSNVVRDKPAMPVSMTEISNVAFFVMIGPN